MNPPLLVSIIIPYFTPRRIANKSIGTIAPRVNDPPWGNDGRMFDMKSSETAREIIIAPSASTLRGKLEKLNIVLIKVIVTWNQ